MKAVVDNFDCADSDIVIIYHHRPLKNMKLKEFIENLKYIEKRRGSDMEVVISDGIPIARPVPEESASGDVKVFITDNDSKKG